jgi:outer membrane protein
VIAALVLATLLQQPRQDSTRLTLNEAVSRALGQYPSVAAARAAREGAGADIRQARAQQLPRLLLDASATQNQLPNLVYPLHSLPTGPTSPLPVFDNTLFQGSAALSWTFFDFGARGARTDVSRALADAAEAALTAAQQDLVARAATAYLRVLTAREVLVAQDQRLAALDAEAARSRRLLTEGKAARVEVLRAEASLARARADRSGTAGQLDVSEHDLAQLAGLAYDDLTRSVLPGAALADTADPTPRVTGEPRTALARQAQDANADVLQARRRLEAAQAGSAAARATRLPELRVQAAVVDRGAPGQSLKAEWQAGVGVSYPLYTGGQRPGQIERAEADTRAAAEQLRLAELGAATAVDRAIASVIESHARVLALKSAVEQSDAVAQVERTSLDVGSGTQTDYLDALAQLLQARSSLIDAAHSEIAAHIELARVTGALSPDWLAQHLESAR